MSEHDRNEALRRRIEPIAAAALPGCIELVRSLWGKADMLSLIGEGQDGLIDGDRAEFFTRAVRLAVDAARALVSEIDGRNLAAEEDFEIENG